MRTSHGTLFLLAILSGLSGCKTGKLDARSAANAMAREFEDWLEFEGGVARDGPPPAEHLDAAHLQIGTFTAPLVVGPRDDPSLAYDAAYDVWFTIELEVVGDIDMVQEVVAHVLQANKDDVAASHIRTEQVELLPPDHVRVRARVRLVDGLAGNAFTIRLALLDSAGEAGNYRNWHLVTGARGGESAVDMCRCRSSFDDGALAESTVDLLDEDACTSAEVPERYRRTGGTGSPCALWNDFVAGTNTNRDREIVLTPDPGYSEHAIIAYPSGTRFFPVAELSTDEACGLQMKCPADEIACSGDTDCLAPDDICCDGTCRDGQTDEEHCGGCGNGCATDEECVDGACGGAPDCTDEIILAAWNFDDSSFQASEMAPNVVARNFTSNDGNPTITIGGGRFWITEIGWNDNPNNYLGCFIEPMGGYELQPVSVSFEQATMAIGEGPTSWSLRSSVDGYVGDLPPTPLPTAEFPDFGDHFVDLSNLTPGPDTVFRLHWYASGATNSQTSWGLDNVVIRGRVCQQ